MSDSSDMLQERLARLENGEPLETCLAGLPEDEAELVRLAATFRSLEYPARPAAWAAGQRARVMAAARTRARNYSMSSNTTQRRWALPLALSGAFALAMVVCVMAGLATLGWVWWQNSQPPAVVVADNPQTAVLAEIRGAVSVQKDGQWAKVEAGQTVAAGQRIRTAVLSSATLIFYDGSRAYLGPNTELWVDSLNAQTRGPRTIILTQWIGETDHDVAHSSDPTSVYEVRTPSGTGTAKGTLFSVFVAASLFVRFDVDEGAVAVTSLDVTVIVIAGQSSTVPAGEPPGEPVFRISGEGEVLQIGEAWNIAGQTFATDANTLIVGNPQVGDWVTVSGRLLADGSKVADQIVLLRRAETNKFSFSGQVESIGEAAWAIAGREVRVDGLTVIGEGIEVGETVKVVGGIAQDGAFWASEIQLVDPADSPFEFTGIVETMGDPEWTISGIAITTNADTKIGDEIEVGDIVKVEGQTLEDGSRLATEIKPADDDDRKFEIVGPVESIDPWNVAGVEFETGDDTEIDEGIEVGDRVKVEGRILEDGRWVADEIKKIDEEAGLRFEFVGEVASTDPWIIGGVTLAADENTEIEGEIAVGDLARVRGRILEDGAWLAETIQPVDSGQGCVDLRTIVSSVEDGQIMLANGQTVDLDSGIPITGDLQPASVILIRICITGEGNTVIVSIIVIFQLDPTATPTATPSGTPIVTPAPTAGGDEGEKVTLCHKPDGKNPHAITVAQSAVSAHLAHGDTLGPCGQGGGGDSGGDDGGGDDDGDDDDDD